MVDQLDLISKHSVKCVLLQTVLTSFTKSYECCWNRNILALSIWYYGRMIWRRLFHVKSVPMIHNQHDRRYNIIKLWYFFSPSASVVIFHIIELRKRLSCTYCCVYIEFLDISHQIETQTWYIITKTAVPKGACGHSCDQLGGIRQQATNGLFWCGSWHFGGLFYDKQQFNGISFTLKW